ncbi:MAG: hypothetical protein AUH33_04170 [Chloroflexi bacterium 13_1_40CM_68_21]|nr:MAG: hypothetical protein AUH33_04170 [Chloroflexi bacterium 13_1_40CM_68_21]
MATPQVPPLASVAAKWRRRVEGASEDFKLGVQQKGGRWQAATDAASSSFKTAVSAGDIEARFKAGVSKAGNAKYQRRATTVGPDRYAAAAPVAEPDFSAGIGPFLAAIGSVDLPARGPRGAAQNYNRVKPIGDALNKLRTSGR